MKNPKWTAEDYDDRKLYDWKPPKLVYPTSATEKEVLQHLKDTFAPLPPYKQMEAQARADNTLVTINTPIPHGYYAFLENTAEKCTSPQTKHSREGMRGARHWVQRVDTAEGLFRRLTDGYGISLMFGERHQQFIRNSNNWRGIFGLILDIDVFEDADHPGAPAPVYSLDELLDRYPLLADICAFIQPSASSLHEGRSFKARGIILFPEPITDQRVYRAFGDSIIDALGGIFKDDAGKIIKEPCIPQNVTKNPVAVGFGNTHNAPQVWWNNATDTDWIQRAITDAHQKVFDEKTEREAKRRKSEARSQTYQKRNAKLNGGSGNGENISAFIQQCDPLAEMISEGLLTSAEGMNRYKWYESDSESACEYRDGKLRIYSATMQAASPGTSGKDAVNAHRFYLYHLTGLDLTKDSDKAKCREFLFGRGYGDDPKAWVSKRQQRAPKLQQTETQTTAAPTETLADNRAHRETATDTFLTDTDNDNTLHMFLVKDATGTGKSHTTLFKARQHGKRTIGQYQHSDLAAQAVLVARQAGFKNPLHLLGREHNWDDSGIAEIPVAERTADLFDKNNCIMVDEVKRYTDKRLAPRTYCELKCPFREGCPHLAQYKGLAQVDFIASCTPNLLFDLNMRGYLQSLVSATEELSDEELAIDAMLGTTSEKTKEIDFATLDDYGISGLYTDITFSESDFKAIKKAWSGTPTGKFASLMLKAFEKKKPQKIVKALRKAFESTADHHTYIAKCLTQHARIGKIEYAETAMHSKESKRLLTEKVVRYTDGGLQFIPVDFDAYKELTQKGIPSILPQLLETTSVGEQVCIPHTPTHALMAGVELKDLTPVWQNGATPIELIGIFLESIGNDQNAPINRMFRAGDPPVAILTFSVPPQAPVGILPHIALLSATTDIDDTKRAFDGQTVTFSEHTGGQLEFAHGVRVYQFQDARLTSASVFEYPLDADGKRKLQDAPIGLKPTAEKRLRKLNDSAKAADGLTAFISYKEFTEHLGDAVNGFDIVTHFDKVAGLNFDGLKFLVVFGYPKVKHEVVMEHARKQYASDREPLPKGDKDRRDENGRNISEYIQLTEEDTIAENGITITERRYKDPRLEKVRHQISTEKLEQAIGRARFPIWTDTITIIFTDTVVHGITERANLFSSAAFNLADTPSDLPDAMVRIKEVEESGDVQDVMETKKVSQRMAYYQTEATRKQKEADRDARILELHTEGKSQREIEKQMKSEGYQKVGKTTIQKVVTFCNHQLVYTNYELQKVTTPSDVGVPCVESENTENGQPQNTNGNGVQKPVSRGEYSKLTEPDARAELQYCEGHSDYAGAAYLRTLFKRKGWDIADMGEKPQQRNIETDVQFSVNGPPPQNAPPCRDREHATDTDTSDGRRGDASLPLPSEQVRILHLYHNQRHPREIANALDFTTEEVYEVLEAQAF